MMEQAFGELRCFAFVSVRRPVEFASGLTIVLWRSGGSGIRGRGWAAGSLPVPRAALALAGRFSLAVPGGTPASSLIPLAWLQIARSGILAAVVRARVGGRKRVLRAAVSFPAAREPGACRVSR